jgi:hypothetical protein
MNAYVKAGVVLRAVDYLWSSYRDAGTLDEARKESGFICFVVEPNQLTGNLKFIDEVDRKTGIRAEFRSGVRSSAERK